MAKPVTINGIHFNTTEKAKSYTRNFLIGLEHSGPRVITPTDKAWDFLYALVLRHPNATEKIGTGIKHFLIKLNRSTHIAFYLKRIDDSIIDISWLYCIRRKKATHRDHLYAAMRAAIQYQLHRLKFDCLKDTPSLCSHCGNRFVSRRGKGFHAHHQPPAFREIADAFIETHAPPTDFDDCPATHAAKFKHENIAYEIQWQAYHQQHANIIIVHPECHKAIHAAERKSENV